MLMNSICFKPNGVLQDDCPTGKKNPMLNSGGVYHVYPIKSTAQIFGEISIHRTLSVGGLVRTVFCSIGDGIDGIRHDISHM
jgi:hypothetical protein